MCMLIWEEIKSADEREQFVEHQRIQVRYT